MSDSPTIEDLRQALAAAEAQHGLDHLETAHAAYRLAISRCHDGREGAAEAEILAMRAIDIYEHGPELHRPHLAGPLSMLASFRDRQGRKSEAEAMLRRAIELQWDEENDEDDMCSEDDLQTLGIDLLEQSRYIEAAEFLNRALCVAERTWGVLHPHLRGHLRTLARAYVGLKRFDEAIELMQRELASCIQHFPDEIDARGELLEEIATCQAKIGHPEEADECLRKAHELRIQYDKELVEKYGVGPHCDPQRLAMDNLLEQANALAKRKDFAGAIAVVEKLVAHRAALSPSPPGCDWNLHQKLAKWYVKVGRFDEALELLHQSRANLESKATTIEEVQREMVELRASPTWRPGSKVKMPAQGMLEQLALVCHDLGSVLYQADRLDESIESYQRSLSIWKVTHATITGFISTGLLNLSSVHGLRGEWNLAGELIEEGLELERSLQPDGSFVARLSGNLAVVRQKQGRLAEAAQLKATAAEMHLKNEGPGQSLAPFELNDAGQMFLALKDWSRAKSCFQRSLALLREADSLPKQPIVGLLLNLSNVEIQQRYFVASLPYLREALPICESEPCNLARECGATLRRLTESLVTTDHFDEAETVGLRWLAYLDKNTSGDEPELPAALANLAMTYHGLKQDEQALCLIERAIPLVERHAVPNDPGVANYFHIQADILNSLHRFAAAKSAEARARQIESRGASNS